MTTDELFRRARLMVAQSKSPTTLAAQLAKLAKRRKRPAKYGRVKIKPEDLPRYDWQDRKDLQ